MSVVYREEYSLLLIGVGGGVSLLALFFFTVAPGSGLLRTGIQLLLAGFALWTVVRPLLVAARMRRAFSFGYRATARVLEVTVTDRREAGATVDSLRYGLATGQWQVAHPAAGAFVAPFRTDAPWVVELAPGSIVEVLVDPDLPRVLLTAASFATV